MQSKSCLNQQCAKRTWLVRVGSHFSLSITSVTAERNALAVSKCPYIVHLYYSLQTKDYIYLVS